LNRSKCQQALLKFLSDFVIRSHSQSSIVTLSDDELYLAGLFSDPSTTKNFTPSKVSDCPDLFSNHEEANTRMLLHAIHADTRFGDMNVKGRIIIKSPDTAVLLLCIHFFPSMRNTKELWFKTGTVTRTKDGKFFSTVFFPIPKNEDVVSQPVKACTAGNNLHTRGPYMANIMDWKIATTILCSCNCPSFEPEFFCVPH
jgi:hypothetical protein